MSITGVVASHHRPPLLVPSSDQPFRRLEHGQAVGRVYAHWERYDSGECTNRVRRTRRGYIDLTATTGRAPVLTYQVENGLAKRNSSMGTLLPKMWDRMFSCWEKRHRVE